MLKKIIRKLLKDLFFLITIIITGCNSYIEHLSSNSNDLSTSERKDKLIEIALTGNWKTSEQEIENALITAFDNFSHKERSASGTSIKMTKIDESRLTIPVKPNSTRSAIIDECSEVSFDLYSLESNNEEWHAITSDDRRLGNVLALVESEFSADISEDDFSIMFAELLNSYALNTAEVWNSITDADVSDYKARSAYKDIANSGKYSYSKWKKNSGNTKFQLTINWNQNPSPFNNCIIAVKGGDAYYVGCGAIQVAQIMAYHKYAKTNISPNLNLIKTKWSQAKDWDGKYDFNLLTSIKNPQPYSSEALRIQLGAFLFDVAEGCKSEYKSNGTSTYESNRLSYLRNQGYTYSNVSEYSFKNIKASIDAGCPVPICGQAKKTVTTTNHRFLWWTWTTSKTSYSNGHAFIIDGYYNMSCTATNGNNKIIITDNFVHCNPGWGGSRNGYYLNGVLNFGVGALANDYAIKSIEGQDRYYQYKLSQTNMLKPTGR